MPEPSPRLAALRYHVALAEYLQENEPETWQWFQSAQSQADHAESLRIELLKQTYRLEPAGHPELYRAVEEVRTSLGCSSPVTVYQSNGTELNAAVYYVRDEIHVVLQGNILGTLDASELKALIGHELAHHQLWSEEDGKHLIADRIVQAMAGDPRGTPSHEESARLMRLYTEIYADRGSLAATGEPLQVVSALVKMHTGLTQVDAAAYLRQADEIFAKAKIQTDGLSHPELFIRARALRMWAVNDPDMETELLRMIEGRTALEKLDLLGQHRLTALTRRWIDQLLQPAWFRTDAVLGQARLYFPGYQFSNAAEDVGLPGELADAHLSVRDYFCYVLLDFAAVDPELELEPLRRGFEIAEHAGWATRLEALAVKELGLKKTEVQRLRPKEAVEERG